jgi:hypothetical protein
MMVGVNNIAIIIITQKKSEALPLEPEYSIAVVIKTYNLR